MLVKHVVEMDEGVVAIQYRTDDRKLTIGGNGRLLPIIRTMFREYFGVDADVWSEVWIQKNKVRASITIEDETDPRYENGLESMKDHGLPVRLTVSHGDIMR